MMKKILLLILIVMSQNFVFAQEEENSATIIFNDSTTLKGYGEIKKESIYFSLTPNGKKSEWSYDAVIGIIFSGYGYSERYEYVLAEKATKPVLMELIEEGNINLYRKNSLKMNLGLDFNNGVNLNNSHLINTTTSRNYPTNFSSTFYVKRSTEEKATDLSSGFKKQSLKYFADCEIIITKLNRRDFTSDKILEMVTYYNNYCDGEEN
ncbi:hypothetical protein [Flavobacterium sp.]|uniref:hypothetical protein n=1 Tax=Flavobacterium sp. TaxID=239 RepID=UPI00261EBE89|nr:hypothetical protein [Flavobacterium sp.]